MRSCGLELAVGEQVFDLIGVDGTRYSGAAKCDERGGSIDFMFFAKLHYAL